MAELDDLATAYVATIDVRQTSADKMGALMREFQTTFNANDPAKAGPVASKIAGLAMAYAALAAKDADVKAQADAEAAAQATP